MVIGASRSGTTMTAGLLQILGVEFGDRMAPRGEDLEINDCVLRLQSALFPVRLWGVRRAFGKLVAARRERWGVFGFKTPHLGQVLPVLADKIPNPVYIYVLRNPLKSAVSWERTHNRAIWKTLPSVLITQFATALFVARTKSPVLMFAYEDATRSPERFVEEFVSATGLSASPATITTAVDFISPTRGYRDARRFFGHVDRINEQGVSGWVCDLADPNASLKIEVLLGDTVVATGTADVRRGDVQRAGHHATGHCGFQLKFPTPIAAAEHGPLKLRVPASRHEVMIDATEVVLSDRGPPGAPANDPNPRPTDTTAKA
ncbi:hypothetical protein DLJ53_04380 [Acuticoccus sediminis]|uniref:Uncharacterized protein n=2 Tax=Acuticoccus sediminis TaxID=2184697 RepID=A0A8B2P182_9HYPH|nr:hypothetical protein DLJ53_04380 [Acuticoccus sediminis]